MSFFNFFHYWSEIYETFYKFTTPMDDSSFEIHLFIDWDEFYNVLLYYY